MENTVAFTVSLDDHYSPVADEKIPYNNVITNIGNGYITQRNEFVCPQAGVYVFSASVIATSNSACNLDFHKNDEKIGTAYSIEDSLTSQGSNMFLLELQESETVSTRSAQGCTMNGSKNYSTFSGFKNN